MTGDGKKISGAEWEVMEVLWKESPLTSWRVAEAISERREWSPKTVKTLLSRLTKKGYLGYDREANRYLYYPLVERSECVGRETDSLLQRMFGGDVSSLILHFCEQSELSAEELASLAKRLEEESEP